MMTEGPEQMHF